MSIRLTTLPGGKADLLAALGESLKADAGSLTEVQFAELHYRIKRHEKNPSIVILCELARADVFKKP